MKVVRLAIVASVIAAAAQPGSAQSVYPERNIRLVYGFPAGNDLAARILAEKLAESLGKPVIVDNITGAAGNIAADRAAKAAPDGYTIGMLPSASMVISPMLYSNLPYDPVKDLTPVSLIVRYPSLLLVNNDVPAETVQDLVALARAAPGKLTYGHVGVGTTSHLAGELFKSMAGIDLQGVPYRGPSPIITDLIGGRITMTFNAPGPSIALVKEGKIRALAVTSKERASFAPDLPSMEESGLSGFEATVWFGLFVPAGTPAAIIERLNQEVTKAMSSPDVGKRIGDIGQVPVSSTAGELAELIRTDAPYWAELIRKAGIKLIE